MAGEVVTAVAEPDIQTPEPEKQPIPDSASVSDHAKQFGPKREEQPAEEQKPALRDPHPSDQQKRSDDGKFSEGRKPIRGKEAVKRIGELTGRARTAEERVAALEAEVSRLKATGAAPQVIARAEAQADAAHADTSDPEPKETDAKYGGDYLKFLDDRSRWNARQEFQTLEAKKAQTTREASAKAAADESMRQFGARFEAAMEKYEDFDTVVGGSLSPWLDRAGKPLPHAVAIDHWITEHPYGPDVLYYLHSNPDETDALMRMTPLQQVERLALITQRFASDPQGLTGDTGSVALRTNYTPPKPPNPVRTEAQRVGTPKAPTDGASSIADHAKLFGQKRR